MSTYTPTHDNPAADLLDMFESPSAPDRPTLYVIQRSVAKSGMSRRLSFYVHTQYADGEPYLQDVTSRVAQVLGYTVHPDTSIRVTGAGMDMHWYTGYCLSMVLFNEGDRIRTVTL